MYQCENLKQVSRFEGLGGTGLPRLPLSPAAPPPEARYLLLFVPYCL